MSDVWRLMSPGVDPRLRQCTFPAMSADILEPESEPAPAPQRTLERLRVAFQGEFGAFGEEAIHLLWRGAAEPVPKGTFEDVMSAAESRDVDYGMLPIESTLVGGLDVRSEERRVGKECRSRGSCEH